MKSLVRSGRDSLISVGVSPDSTKGAIYWYSSGLPRVDSTLHPLQWIAMRDDSIAYAVGDSGLIVTNAKLVNSLGTPTLSSPTLKVYPNPCVGVFFTKMDAPHRIKVYDLSGRVVCRQSRLSGNHLIDLNSQPGGLYILAAELENGFKIFDKIILIE
jgi:hypothetical protein